MQFRDTSFSNCMVSARLTRDNKAVFFISYAVSKNLAKPQSETLFEEDLKFMEMLLSKNKNLVKIKKVKDEECGIETTYITIKKK